MNPIPEPPEACHRIGYGSSGTHAPYQPYGHNGDMDRLVCYNCKLPVRRVPNTENWVLAEYLVVEWP